MLNARQRCVVDTLLPSGAHPALGRGAFDAGFDEFEKEFRATATPAMRAGLTAALWVAAWLAPALAGALPPLDRHPRAERERILESLGRSRVYALRQCLLLLKAVVCFSWGADFEVRKATGFPS